MAAKKHVWYTASAQKTVVTTITVPTNAIFNFSYSRWTVIITALDTGAEVFNLFATCKGKSAVSSHWPLSTVSEVILWCMCLLLTAYCMQVGTLCHQRSLPVLLQHSLFSHAALQSIPVYLVAVDTSLSWRFSLMLHPTSQHFSACPSRLVTLPFSYSSCSTSPLNSQTQLLFAEDTPQSTHPMRWSILKVSVIKWLWEKLHISYLEDPRRLLKPNNIHETC